MYEKLELCPSCKNTKFTNFLICTDYSVSGESFALTKCNKCELVFTNPRPVEASLPSYYKSDQYISHKNKGNSLINIIYKVVRRYTLNQKNKLILRFTEKGSLLDYGCGTGHFLSYARKIGWTTQGYEPDHQARNIASSKKIAIVDSLKNIKEKVDVITAWHVIEHVGELRKTMKALKSVLKNGGYLFIALPNLNSYDAQHYKEYWAGYDVPRHLYHFSQSSFGILIDKLKLELIDTIPMKFDSFYVSMLSEKNKTGKNNFFQALQVGRKSNLAAKQTGEYSSLIYVLKK